MSAADAAALLPANRGFWYVCRIRGRARRGRRRALCWKPSSNLLLAVDHLSCVFAARSPSVSIQFTNAGTVAIYSDTYEICYLSGGEFWCRHISTFVGIFHVGFSPGRSTHIRLHVEFGVYRKPCCSPFPQTSILHLALLESIAYAHGTTLDIKFRR